MQSKTLNKVVTLEKFEARALEIQAKLSDLGYKPFLFLVTIEKLEYGLAGCFWCETETIAVSEDYCQSHFDFCMDEIIPHEMAHLYVSKYFPNAKEDHGEEFCMIMNALGKDPNGYHNMTVGKF